jgi:hypothetical protein
MAPKSYSGARGKLIHEKNGSQKTCVRFPLKNYQLPGGLPFLAITLVQNFFSHREQ